MTTTKHALRYNGAPYDADAQLRHDDTRITSGTGRALCACGAISEVLPNGAARRVWFKAHRDTEAVAQADLMELLQGPEEEEGTPAAAAAAPAADPVPEAPAIAERVLPFALLAPVSYWRYLGRDGSRFVVELLFPAVKFTADSKQRAVVLTGPEADVQAACETLSQLWLEAVEAAAEWSTTDPAYLARPRGGVEGRMAAYHMKGEFLLAHIKSQAAARKRALAKARKESLVG